MNHPTDREPERRRIRGVRASRERLTHALARAGLRTQAALAEHIADIEGLDTAPRHLVNRVFRELPVDLLSLERIARALDVPAHTLYLTQFRIDGAGSSPPVVDVPPDQGAMRMTPPPFRWWPFVLAGVVGGVLATSLAWSLWAATPFGCGGRAWVRPPHTEHGRLGIVIGRFGHNDGNMGQLYLAATLGNARMFVKEAALAQMPPTEPLLQQYRDLIVRQYGPGGSIDAQPGPD